METWLIFAIISVFAAGFHNFTLKIAAEKHYDISVINIYSYAIATIIFGSYILFNYQNMIFDNFLIIFIIAILNSFFFFISMFSRIVSMKNIDTVIFFPLYKTMGPVLVTFVSIFFFGESLQLKEIIGIIIGIAIPLLLITNSEKKIQKNLFLGVVLVGVTALLTTITSGLSKEIMVKEYNLTLFLFLVSISGLIFSLISLLYFNKKKKTLKTKGIFKFGIISGFLHLASFLSFMLALKGNLAIAYTINSFSILIPIILSVIFYKEHFNLKKGLIIFLSIISIILFI